MKSVNKIKRLWGRLSVRLCFYFLMILALFSTILVALFTKLFEQSVMDTYRIAEQKRAERVAERMRDFVEESDKQGFLAYIDTLRTIEGRDTTDIWIVSNEKSGNGMSQDFTNVDIENVELPEEMEQVILSAFAGEEGYRTGYDEMYEMSVIRIGCPIFDRNHKVMGAVIIVSLVENQSSVLKNSAVSILVSAVLSMAISMAIALFITKQISSPLRDMRVVALQLAHGDYEAKTKTTRTDEIGILAKTLDILSDRLQEAEMERDNEEQMRMDFFANVSHELRTPITVMRGYTESLVDGVVTEEEKKQQYYERMLSECKSMERLVQDLLLLSKMQNPSFKVDKEPVNLVEIFDEICRSASVIAKEKKIQIHFQCDDDCLMMMGDYDRLRQMFLVIVDNAVKFSQMEGNVYINIDSQDKIVIKIRDEGIGISKEEMTYIFRKFYKSKLRQNAKGSGLGLMIAKYIAQKHEGVISVESEAGVGTEFSFVFDKIQDEVL